MKIIDFFFFFFLMYENIFSRVKNIITISANNLRRN